MTPPLPPPSDSSLARQVHRVAPAGPRTIVNEPHRSAFTSKDIFFAVFRHKWLVLICALLGLVLAVNCYLFYPKAYQSSAKLLVRYVVERSAVDSVDTSTSGSSRNSDSVIASEAEIL